MAFVMVCAVASLLGTNRANSPLQVKRMITIYRAPLRIMMMDRKNAKIIRTKKYVTFSSDKIARVKSWYIEETDIIKIEQALK